MTTPIPLSGLLPEEIASTFGLSPPYRGKQVFIWRHKHGATIDEMTNIPLPLREQLKARAVLFSSVPIETKADGKSASKLRILLEDRYIIETVVLEDETGRKTVCLSAQAGCAMGCSFCKTGTLGFTRNLTVYEITEQFLHAKAGAPDVGNIVFMGMGEPMENLNNVLKAAAILHEPAGVNIGYGRMTISTCGIAEGIKRLAEEKPSIRLALSLVTANQKKRETLMPSARKNPLPLLRESLLRYQAGKGGRITLEYVLMRGVNDGVDEIRYLTEFTKDLDCLINIIPLNPVPGLPYRRPDSVEVNRFIGAIKSAGLNVTRRTTRGRGIAGACGQLGGDLG